MRPRTLWHACLPGKQQPGRHRCWPINPTLGASRRPLSPRVKPGHMAALQQDGERPPGERPGTRVRTLERLAG
jgi:hypothetical protein